MLLPCSSSSSTKRGNSGPGGPSNTTSMCATDSSPDGEVDGSSDLAPLHLKAVVSTSSCPLLLACELSGTLHLLNCDHLGGRQGSVGMRPEHRPRCRSGRGRAAPAAQKLLWPKSVKSRRSGGRASSWTKLRSDFMLRTVYGPEAGLTSEPAPPVAATRRPGSEPLHGVRTVPPIPR
jgi:hypothetical protein